MDARCCAWLALAALGLAPTCGAAVATPESFADYNYSRPENWTRKIDVVTHLAVLRPDPHTSIVFIQPQNYGGSADSWHREIWTRLTSAYKARGTATDGRRGNFTTTWGAFDKGDGTQAWFCLYTSIYNGHGEGLLLSADGEGAFRAYLTAANQLVDGITFGATNHVAANAAPTITPSPVVSTPTAPKKPASAVALSPPAAAVAHPTTMPEGPSTAASAVASDVAQLTVEPPAGWAVQHDARTGMTVMMPPDAPNLNVAGFIAFPAVAFSGTAEEFQRRTLETTIGGGRLLEPLKGGLEHGLYVTSVHFVSAKGENMRFVIYTARWANRAQAFVFATVREDLYRRDGPIAHAAMAKVVVPGAAGPNLPASPASNSGKVALSHSPTPPAVNSPVAPSVNANQSEAAAADYIPVLNYNEPPNFFRGAMRNFAEYTSSQVNFALCVYPFRPYTGDIKTAFQQTLLRDWIDVQYREENVAGPPRFSANNTPGADSVIEAHFQENIVGLLNERHRILIISGNRAAIVDLKARNAQCWQTAFPSASVLLASMRVERKEGPPSLANGPGPQGAALAGLYMGTKAKYLALGVTDFTGHAPALHYFLFSRDGRVFRCYDFPPGGSETAAHHFDFDSAARQDPGNSGRFAVRGNQLYIKWGGPNDDEILTTVNEPNVLVLDSVQYVRKW